MSMMRIVSTIGAIIVLSALCVPRMLIDYGYDGDPVRGVLAAENLLRTGTYSPSRLPGNPLFEYLTAGVLVFDGHILSNLLVFLSYLLCIWAFYLLIRDRGASKIYVLIFAFTPILVKNSVVTLDYIPGLALLLWGYLCLTRNKQWLGIICVGLSIGFRLPNALLVAPMALYLYATGEKTCRILLTSMVTVCIGLLFYVSIFAIHGFQMLAIPEHPIAPLRYWLGTGYRLMMTLGPWALLGAGVFLCMRYRRIARIASTLIRAHSPLFIAELSAIVLFGLLFLRHSYECEYLIPALPFLYLATAPMLTRQETVVLGALIVLFGFVSIETRGGDLDARRMTLKPAWGIIIQDYLDRKHLQYLRAHLYLLTDQAPALIITGMPPTLTYHNPLLTKDHTSDVRRLLTSSDGGRVGRLFKLRDADVYLLRAISKENLKKVTAAGYAVRMFQGTAPFIGRMTWGYSLRDLGIEELEIKSRERLLQPVK